MSPPEFQKSHNYPSLNNLRHFSSFLSDVFSPQISHYGADVQNSPIHAKPFLSRITINLINPAQQDFVGLTP